MQFVKPSIPKRRGGSRLRGLLARFLLRAPKVPGSIPAATPVTMVARCICGRSAACGGLPSIKPAVCKVTPAVAGVTWRAAIWALAQAGNRAGKTRQCCAATRPRAQARLQTCAQLSPRRSTAPSVLAPCGASALASQWARWPSGQGVGLWSRRSQAQVLAGLRFCDAFLVPPGRGVENGPPVGLEPTTSRLLSGCSAN
jgi:hypothetical protein